MQRASAFLMCEDARMSDARARTRLLIESYLAETGLDPSTLARVAGLSPSTITRFLNSPDFSSIPSTRTMEKLERAVILWRTTSDGAKGGSQPSRAIQHGRFIQDADQLALLRLWDEMSPIDRRRAALVLRALAMDHSKFG